MILNASSVENIKVIDNIYQVKSILGTGTQGVIFKVKEKNQNKILALKLINLRHKDSNNIDQIIDSLKVEFKILKSLNHKNIIKVYDFGHDNKLDLYYYTMEYIEGKTLSEFIKSKNDPDYIDHEFPNIIHKILLGLNYLHRNDIIHFDIKPENILVYEKKGKSYVKILDFGLSELKKQLGENGAKGTLNYMAPEIFIDPSQISEKIDIYSLGMSLLHSLCNKKNVKKYNTPQEYIESINNLSSENEKLLLTIKDEKMRLFISALIEVNPEIRVGSIIETIGILNSICQRNLAIPKLFSESSYENNSKFLLRTELVEKIIALNEEKESQIIYLLGDNGSGKSKILNQIHYRLSLALKTLIRIEISYVVRIKCKIVKKLFTHLYNLYGNQPNLKDEFEKLKTQISTMDEEDEECSLLFNKIIDLLIEVAKDRKLTILFDDLENYDDHSLIFINRLREKLVNQQNICIILAVSTSSKKRKIIDMLHFIEFDQRILKFKIDKLTKSEVKEITKLFFSSISNIPSSFYKELTEYSQGNFRKLMLFFDSFIRNKVIKRMSGIFIFSKIEKYYQILNQDSSEIIKQKIGNITQLQREILGLIAVSYLFIDAKDIAEVLKIEEYKIKRSLNNLISRKIIKIKKTKTKEYYAINGQEISNYFYKKTSNSKLKIYYQNLLKIPTKTHNGKITNQILNIISKDDDKNLTKILKEIDFLTKNLDKDKRLIEYDKVLLALIRITGNLEIKFKLKIIYTDYFYNTKSPKKAIDYFKKRVKEFNKIKNVYNKISFIKQKIDFYDFQLYNYNIHLFLKKNIKFFYANTSNEEFFEIMISLNEYLFMIPTKEKLARLIMQNLLNKLELEDREELKIYIIWLKVIRINNLKELATEESLTEIESYINYFEANNILDNKFLSLLFTYINISLYLNLGQNIEKIIKRSLKKCYALKKSDLVFSLLKYLSAYHFGTNNFEKSLQYIEKAFDFANKTKQRISDTDLDNMLSIKSNLYLPATEIKEFSNEIATSLKEKNSFSSFSHHLFNEAIIYYKLGEFKKAKRAVNEILQYAQYHLTKEIFGDLYIIFDLYTDLFEFDEIIKKLSVLKEKNILTNTKFEEYITQVKDAYRYQISYPYHPDKYQDLLDGTLKRETPFMIVNYIRKEKKIPAIAQVMETVDKIYKNKVYVGHYLVYLVTKFMLTKNNIYLDEIYKYFKKTSILGYKRIAYYTIVPFLEFMVLVKTPQAELLRFLKVYDEINNYLLDHMDETQKRIYKNSLLQKRMAKTVFK